MSSQKNQGLKSLANDSHVSQLPNIPPINRAIVTEATEKSGK
jgi:hypothetical protein